MAAFTTFTPVMATAVLPTPTITTRPTITPTVTSTSTSVRASNRPHPPSRRSHDHTNGRWPRHQSAQGRRDRSGPAVSSTTSSTTASAPSTTTVPVITTTTTITPAVVPSYVHEFDWTLLPDEVWLLIFEHLTYDTEQFVRHIFDNGLPVSSTYTHGPRTKTYKHLLAMSQVCKRFFRLSRDRVMADHFPLVKAVSMPITGLTNTNSSNHDNTSLDERFGRAVTLRIFNKNRTLNITQRLTRRGHNVIMAKLNDVMAQGCGHFLQPGSSVVETCRQLGMQPRQCVFVCRYVHTLTHTRSNTTEAANGTKIPSQMYFCFDHVSPDRYGGVSSLCRCVRAVDFPCPYMRVYAQDVLEHIRPLLNDHAYMYDPDISHNAENNSVTSTTQTWPQPQAVAGQSMTLEQLPNDILLYILSLATTVTTTRTSIEYTNYNQTYFKSESGTQRFPTRSALSRVSKRFYRLCRTDEVYRQLHGQDRWTYLNTFHGQPHIMVSRLHSGRELITGTAENIVAIIQSILAAMAASTLTYTSKANLTYEECLDHSIRGCTSAVLSSQYDYVPPVGWTLYLPLAHLTDRDAVYCLRRVQ